MAKHLLISDPHFGGPECSLVDANLRRNVYQFWKDREPFDKVILLGDFIDVNYASFTEAIFGGRSDEGTPHYAFAAWLDEFFGEGKIGVTEMAYLPGNHDYKVWDLLATEKNFMKPLAQGGEAFKKSNLLFEDRFDDSFFEGVVPPTLRKKFYIKYPDIEFEVKGKTVLATHGHYLCRIQTMGATMPKMEAKYDDPETARRKFFQSTARYQTVANAFSYQKEWRTKLFSVINGFESFWDFVTGKEGLRDRPIDDHQLRAMEEYLDLYRGKKPDVFVFGHTHVPGRADTGSSEFDYRRLIPEKNIHVWNTGHFLTKDDCHGSFIIVDDRADEGNEIQLFVVDEHGTVKPYQNGGVS
ncbi:MAG TPA: metallophosphoesterase [bacterium]|nr:metallophosphoesterase [bacterium]